LRATGAPEAAELGREYENLIEAYDRGGLPYERALVRLSYARWLMGRGRWDDAVAVNAFALRLAQRHAMRVMEVDAWELGAELAVRLPERSAAEGMTALAEKSRSETGYWGPGRP